MIIKKKKFIEIMIKNSKLTIYKFEEAKKILLPLFNS